MSTLHKSQELLIGAHTSASGGAHHALIEGKSIGATTIQFFTANQKRWNSAPLKQQAIDLWKETVQETGIQKIMSHDSYLINLGSPNPEGLAKSRKAFKEEIQRCLAFDISFLNFHPGAALSGSMEDCLDTIVESLKEVEHLVSNSNLRLLLETTAGQGSAVGYRFEHIAYIIDRVKGNLPIGVCMDTCHSFAAGYDLRTKQACQATIEEFDEVIGLEHLYAFHLNDSVKGLGSRVDRHAPLGEGMIGLECFKFLMQDQRLRELPKYLETPGGPPLWEKEIAMLRKMAEGT